MGEHIISIVVIFPKMPSEAKTLDLYHELKSVLIGQSSLTIKGYFCGKCYDSAGLVGALSCILSSHSDLLESWLSHTCETVLFHKSVNSISNFVKYLCFSLTYLYECQVVFTVVVYY